MDIMVLIINVCALLGYNVHKFSPKAVEEAELTAHMRSPSLESRRPHRTRYRKSPIQGSL